MEGAREGVSEEASGKEVGYRVGAKARHLWGLWLWVERKHSTFEKQMGIQQSLTVRGLINYDQSWVGKNHSDGFLIMSVHQDHLMELFIISMGDLSPTRNLRNQHDQSVCGLVCVCVCVFQGGDL